MDEKNILIKKNDTNFKWVSFKIKFKLGRSPEMVL